MQDSSTAQMIFSVSQLVAYLSVVFTLEVGDLIFTGTPPGIGHALRPPVYLTGGETTEVEIDTLGTLRNSVVGE
jgi:2-keto-4-pentenoate hydratase/2-oxohepta-3-ene-1,7-dioic acid hydratase in catechol pathway